MLEKNKLITICFFSFGVFPILPFKLKGIPVFILLVIAIWIFFNKKAKKFPLKLFLIFSSLFFINILSLLNTFSFPGKKIETILSLVLVPIGFFMIYEFISRKHKLFFTKTYIFSTLILAISHFFYYFTIGLFNGNSLKVNSFRKAVTEIPILNNHPIYVSVFLSIAVLFSIYFFKKENKKNKLILIAFCILFFIDLFLISSKGVLVALFFALIFYLFISIKKRNIRLIVLTVFISSFILSIFYIPTLERRFRELKIKSTYQKIQPNNSSSVRIGIYKCAFKTIMEKPLFGYGFGTSPQKKCYKTLSHHLFLESYNSHNQYLGYVLNAGVFGAITLLFFIFFILRTSWNNKDYLYVSIIILYAIIMLTENILERHSGLILFIFIVNLFFITNQKKKLR